MKNIRKILIVDDDMDDREILHDAFMALKSNGMECEPIESGDALLQYLDSNKNTLPALIMLDLNMPGKDGRETLKEIKANKFYHHIPIIVFSTSSAYQDVQTSYNFGANCFISKPDTFHKLVELASCIEKLWLQNN